MSDPRDTNPRRSDMSDRRLDFEAMSSRTSMWPWLAALVAILVILGVAIGYNRTEQASNNHSNAPTTTGAAPSQPQPAYSATQGGNKSVTPAAPAPNEGPR